MAKEKIKLYKLLQHDNQVDIVVDKKLNTALLRPAFWVAQAIFSKSQLADFAITDTKSMCNKTTLA